MVSATTALATIRTRLRLQQLEFERSRYENDPVAWITEKTNGWMYAKLKEIANSIVDNRRTAVPSCHEAGKSWLSARLAAWWIACHPPGTAFVVTTAPTNRQVKAVLWKELRRAVTAAKIPGRLNQTEWWINNEMVALGLKPSDYDPTAFQGLHCLTDDHEVLTNNGWKVRKDLDQDKDNVLSVDLHTKKIEWNTINKIYKYKYSGDLNTVETKSLSFSITDNHRLPIKVNDEWKLIKFEDIKGGFHLLRTGIWEGTDFNIPEEFSKFGWSKKDFAFFIGYWIGDGGLRQHHSTGRFYEVLLYRTKDFQIDKFLENTQTYTGKDYIGFSNRKCAEWLLNNVGRYQPDRIIPRFLLDASTEILDSLLEGLWYSDGTFNRDVTMRKGFYSCSRKLMDNVQEVMLKLGRPSTIGINRFVGEFTTTPTGRVKVGHDTLVISWSKEEPNGYMVYKDNVIKEYYDDIVWCIETNNGTFFTRRNGKVHLTGNSKYLLAILDEGCGIPEDIYVAANSLIANEYGRILVIGNPDDPMSHFAKICDVGSGWSVIPVSAFDTPNFTNEPSPQEVRDVLVGPLYVEEMRRDVGEQSAVYISKVLGRFPVNQVDGVVLLSWIRRCQSLLDTESGEYYAPDDMLPVELGVDVGAGGDETSIRERRGIVAGRMWEANTKEPEEAFLLVLEAIQECLPTRVKIDIIGIGWGLLGMLRQTALQGRHYNELAGTEVDISNIEFVGVNVGQGSTDPTRFMRLRSQLWWEVGRELSISKGWDLSLLDDVTIGQLIAPTWKKDLADRIVVESKQDTMKRTKKPSPNRADALLLAYCEPPGEDQVLLEVYYDPVEIGPQV